MDEIERPHCLIVRGAGRCSRAGEAMSLGILNHGWLHCSDTPANFALGRARLPDIGHLPAECGG